jgi:DNA-directed RNA polymerase subunit RPC12/RpoP
MNEEKDSPRKSIFRNLALRRSSDPEPEPDKPPVELSPAMPELGTAPCPVCGREVAVFVTRTKRPFINCGFCSARIFYNGSRSMRLLQKHLKGSPANIVQPSRENNAHAEPPNHSLGRSLPSTSILRRKP